MSEYETLEHEVIKDLLKLYIMNNPNLLPEQKQMAKDNIDRAAQKADWIIEVLRGCGIIKS